MLRYLEEVFGVKSELEKWDGKRKLPLYLRGKREYYVLSFQNQKNLLIKVSTESFNMVTFRKQILQLNQYTELDIILWMETITAYQRQALIKNRISFIVPGFQIFVPEWGTCLKEYYASLKENREKMTSVAQYLLLYFIYRKENEGKSQKELADKLGMSEMQVSRAVQELTQFHLVTVLREGKNKIVKAIANGKELYEMSQQYCSSPVQKRIYVCSKDAALKLPMAGETALSKRSMLNPPKHNVFALDKRNANLIPKELIIDPKWTLNDDYIEIELWKYNPDMYAENGMADVISLSLSLAEEDDERIEMQIEEMMEGYKW